VDKFLLHHAVISFQEPTGRDSASKNGKNECSKVKLFSMACPLLFSSGLSPKFLSAALINVVCLKSRLWHSGIEHTPFEAWTGTMPELIHIHAFGALVTARKPGKLSAKVDEHTAHVVLLRFGAMPKQIR